jgi:uncharacterized membrane protein YkoI
VSFIKKAAGATAAVAVLAVAPALAATQRAQKSSSTTTSTSQSAGEAALTGATLTSASDAAIAAVPGGKVTRASNETDSSNSKAAYEVHVTKSDGSRVVVIEDSSFAVLSTQADQGPGPGGRGGPHGAPGG